MREPYPSPPAWPSRSAKFRLSPRSSGRVPGTRVPNRRFPSCVYSLRNDGRGGEAAHHSSAHQQDARPEERSMKPWVLSSRRTCSAYRATVRRRTPQIPKNSRCRRSVSRPCRRRRSPTRERSQRGARGPSYHGAQAAVLLVSVCRRRHQGRGAALVSVRPPDSCAPQKVGCFRHQMLLRGCGQWYRCGRDRVGAPQ